MGATQNRCEEGGELIFTVILNEIAEKYIEKRYTIRCFFPQK
jgi:hypothetical protein